MDTKCRERFEQLLTSAEDVDEGLSSSTAICSQRGLLYVSFSPALCTCGSSGRCVHNVVQLEHTLARRYDGSSSHHAECALRQVRQEGLANNITKLILVTRLPPVKIDLQQVEEGST